ncbi:MAG: selenocysteine-specific translation elongation factor, partial [Gemmatimonadales bacterium]
MILGTAGHIDHGKTALVRALTGVDTDRLPEEKRRGITIDLGFAPLVIDGFGTIGIVDVPGHEGFVKTMLAGASGVDLALLVVAADEGVMPQTREHLEILSLLAIPNVIVALTKSDLVEPEWLGLVSDEVTRLVKDTGVELSDIIAVSSTRLTGITDLRSAIGRVAATVVKRSGDDLFRMPVDRAFTVKGTGTVVTGTVWTGTIDRDATVVVQPGNRVSRVRAIQSHDRPVQRAEPGMRAAIALADCDVSDVPRGTVLVSDAHWVPTHAFDATLSLMDGFNPTPRTRVRIHIGTSETGGRFGALRRDGNGSTARVILDEPLIARGGDRFVIRLPSPARTVGGGKVVDPYPVEKRRGRPRSSTPASETGSVNRLLESSDGEGLSVRMIPIRTGVSPSSSRRQLEQATATIVGERAYSQRAIRDIENSIETVVGLEMANHSLEAGVSLQTVRAAVRARSDVIDLALERLQKRRRIELAGSLAKPFGWVSQLGEREQALSDAILHEICTSRVEPPSVAELTGRFGAKTQAMLRKLEREGQ